MAKTARKIFTMRIHERDHAFLAKLAEENGESLASVIRQALREYLDHRDLRKAK